MMIAYGDGINVAGGVAVSVILGLFVIAGAVGWLLSRRQGQ